VDFTGKRVGQLGTGSTGIQAAPVIAETAAHLTVFQRTANYSVPARNGPLSLEFKRWIRDSMDEIRTTMQAAVNGHPFLISETLALEVSPEERQARYEKGWEIGGLRFRAIFRDLVTNNEANATAVAFLKDKIRKIVKDPATAEKLADIDHPYAAKRPPIDTDYFETFNRDNVDLIDIRADPIERITPQGIKTKSGAEYPLDIIVFATGFDGMTGSLLKMDIRGRDVVSLKDAWAAGPRNYLGLQVAQFPNMFMITGPGSPSVLCNMPVAIEQHVEWITDCIAHLRKAGLTRIEPKEEAMDFWVAEVNAAANATVLPQAKHSWYLGANIPGKPRVFMPYAGGMAHYRKICAEVAAKNYEGFKLSA
jgi:cation diffusion facilitator CzcD-associated flavoprotein CzcO